MSAEGEAMAALRLAAVSYVDCLDSTAGISDVVTCDAALRAAALQLAAAYVAGNPNQLASVVASVLRAGGAE